MTSWIYIKKKYSQSSPMVFCVSPVGRTSQISLTYSKADLGLTEQRTIEAFKPNRGLTISQRCECLITESN